MSKVVENSEKRITQNWGNGGHGGIDIGFSSNEEFNKVYPNCKGIVVEIQDGLDRIPNSSDVKSWGNYVLVKHDNGMHSRYAHLRKGLPVRKGQEVDEHTLLGIIGESGNTFGRHLHFEVSKGYSSSTRIDPTPYLTKAICEPVHNSQSQSQSSAVKSVEEVAKEVIAGKWGNGQERKNKLTASGYNYNEVQAKVNEMLSNPSKPSKTVYVVQNGDTLSSIARKYNTTWQKIYEKNKSVIGSNPNLIKPGQKLEI